MRLSRSFVRHRAVALGAACLALATSCGRDTVSGVNPPSVADAAAAAVTLFGHLADSVAKTGGDSAVGGAYAALAEAVRQSGRVSPIVISVDGVPTDFLASAQQTEFTFSPCGSNPACLAPVQMTKLRTLVAWQQNDPHRIVQLSSASDADSIFAYLHPTFAAPMFPTAWLLFMDGKGGTFFGTSGSQKFGVTTSTTPCTTAGPTAPFPAVLPVPRCTQADFSITFSAKAEPSSFLVGKNNATGSHSFFMATQPVLGARFELGTALTPRPPIPVTTTVALPATLTAKVDSLVHLTLTVSNPSSTPVQVTFGSGKHYDFTISDASTGAVVWRWGMGVFFTQVVSTETIPANGSLAFTTQWQPAQKGSLIATGSLVSLSHNAAAKVAVWVP